MTNDTQWEPTYENYRMRRDRDFQRLPLGEKLKVIEELGEVSSRLDAQRRAQRAWWTTFRLEDCADKPLDLPETDAGC
jgi:uncharacterized protein YecT (DUF1311 family)